MGRRFSQQIRFPPSKALTPTVLHTPPSPVRGWELSKRQCTFVNWEALDIQVRSFSLAGFKTALHIRYVRCSQLMTGHYHHVMHISATCYHEPCVCLQKHITSVPEPRDERHYFLYMLVTLVIKSHTMLHFLTVTENFHIETRFFGFQPET